MPVRKLTQQPAAPSQADADADADADEIARWEVPNAVPLIAHLEPSDPTALPTPLPQLEHSAVHIAAAAHNDISPSTAASS